MCICVWGQVYMPHCATEWVWKWRHGWVCACECLCEYVWIYLWASVSVSVYVSVCVYVCIKSWLTTWLCLGKEYYSGIEKSVGRNVTLGLENQLCYIVAGCPWASYSTSLDLDSLNYKTELKKKYLPPRDITGITFTNRAKALSTILRLYTYLALHFSCKTNKSQSAKEKYRWVLIYRGSGVSSLKKCHWCWDQE